MVVAIIRGTSRYFLESTAKVSMASICSVTLMVPSSADIEDMACAVTIKPANRGANALLIEIKIVYPINPSAPNLENP